jgi:hypothetical protein
VDREDARQLANRIGVVLDSKIYGFVDASAVPAAFTHDEERGRLPAAAVSACRVAGGQGD